MTPERLQQIESLYHAVCETSPEKRAALLAEADPELRSQVESLLTERSGEDFLERPAMRLANDSTSVELPSGECLGPYRIEGKLGEGGMGEVYRAIDSRLGRAVAIKITREQFTARFAREARAISSLNHPNVCTLYDIGPNYLVMELVEGETLAARLKGGPLPLSTALEFASQSLAALNEAHDRGVVHRDLKPGNIMIGKTGVKVLDFGLALSAQDESVTDAHMIIGTPAYMAPEQRAGKAADARTDIYAFGCVLYEMCTGTRPGALRKRLQPRKLDRIISRCLEEEPERRWQSAAELRRELASITPARRWPRIAAAVAATAAILCVAGYVYLHRTPKLTQKDTIVLSEFENKTGDPVFDQTLRHGLAVQLQQSPYITLVSDESMRQSLHLMDMPLDTRVTSDIAREICQRTGASGVLDGSIAAVGTQYVLWLRARNCQTGETLAQEQVQAPNKEEVLNALTRIAVQMRTRLGESLTTVQQHSVPLEQATTSSLEALKAYSAARDALFAHGFSASIPHLQRAIAIDPQFAMAHGDLGFFSWNMGQTDLGAQETLKAYQLRDRVSEREKLYILFLYDRQVTGNLQKELQTLETWAQMYPRDYMPPGVIAGWVTRGTGQYERGIQAAEQAIRLDPNVPFPHEGLAIHQIALNRFSEAESALRVAAARKLELPEMLVSRYYLAFFKDDITGMNREVARAAEEHAEDWIAHNQALVLARSGRIVQARSMWDRAIALAKQAGKSETAAIYQAAEAVCEAHLGNLAAAKQRARLSLQLGKGRDVEYAAAFALALAGELRESQRIADDLEKRFPEDTPVQFEYLPTLRALAALAHRSPADAVDRLQKAVPYDLAMPGTSFFARFGGLYTAYVRGQAHLAGGRGSDAAVEFQKVIDHRGIVWADPIGALSFLQLGRAYAMSGDKTRAKVEYERFLTLWKDADAGIPVFQQARTEFAKL